MRRALQAASLAPLRTQRPPCLSLCVVLRRQVQTNSKTGSQEKISQYSIEYVTEMAEKERVSMTDHSNIDGLIAAKEREWERQSERDEDGAPVFIVKMEEYGKGNHPWYAIQSQYFYLNRRDVRADEEYRRSNALHYCAQCPSLSPMMQWLLEDGNIDPNKGNILHSAVQNSNFECVSLLLNDERVDKNTQDVDGHTPLHYAVYKNDPEMVSLLLQHGCNKDIQNDYGKTALMIAERKKHTQMINLLEPRIEN